MGCLSSLRSWWQKQGSLHPHPCYQTQACLFQSVLQGPLSRDGLVPLVQWQGGNRPVKRLRSKNIVLESNWKMGSHQQRLLAFIPCHKNVLSEKEKKKAQAWEAHWRRKSLKGNSNCLTPPPSQFLWAAWFGAAVSIGDNLFFHVDPPPKGLSALSGTPGRLQLTVLTGIPHSVSGVCFQVPDLMTSPSGRYFFHLEASPEGTHCSV